MPCHPNTGCPMHDLECFGQRSLNAPMPNAFMQFSFHGLDSFRAIRCPDCPSKSETRRHSSGSSPWLVKWKQKLSLPFHRSNGNSLGRRWLGPRNQDLGAMAVNTPEVAVAHRLSAPPELSRLLRAETKPPGHVVQLPTNSRSKHYDLVGTCRQCCCACNDDGWVPLSAKLAAVVSIPWRT